MSRIDQGIEGQEGADFADDHDDAHGDGRMVAGDTDDWSHDGAADHGEEADEGRCTAGIASLVLHGHGETAGTHHGQGRHGQEQEDDDDGQGQIPPERSQQQDAANGCQQQGAAEQFPVSHAARHAARDSTGNHQADAVDAEDIAEGLGRYAVDVLENEGRPGNIGKESGKTEALHDAVAHEVRLPEEGGKASEARHAAGNAAPLRQGFMHDTGRGRQDQTDQGDEDEDAFPRRKAQDLAADDRCQDRRDTVDQHEHGKEPRQGAALADIAGNGPGQDDTGAAGTTLDEAEQKEDGNR